MRTQTSRNRSGEEERPVFSQNAGNQWAFEGKKGGGDRKGVGIEGAEGVINRAKQKKRERGILS